MHFRYLKDYRTSICKRSLIEMYYDCVFLQGNAHVVNNGYFYYFRKDEPKIVKYDLALDKQAGKLSEL